MVWAVCARADERDPLLIHTAQGSVRGHWDTEHEIFAFYGVPYATVPTGTNRFKAPLPPPVWLHPKDAINMKIVCPQANFIKFTPNIQMQEDCLVANVFVPDTAKKNLPVVVYVHGGAYLVGGGLTSTPKNLVKTGKVIAVSFNYRLGVHGFLCLGTKDAPGNAGMKDQVALLRWVKENIASFGGDPNDVTITGHSAGSSAVDLLMLSKSTEGLFNKVIPESGANVGVWSMQIDPLENAKTFAKSLNFTNGDDVYALENFYKTAPFEMLTSDAVISLITRSDSHFVFTPCVEHDTGDEGFLDDSPVNILKKGNYKKYPMLYGFASMEGLFRVEVGFDFEFMAAMNTKFSKFLPADLQFENDEEREEIAKKVKEFYFGDKTVSVATISNFIDYFTDVIIAYPTLRSVKLHIEAGNDKIYLYEYSYPQEFPIPSGNTVTGAKHCAQTHAVLDAMRKEPGGTSEEYEKHIAVMREIWLNFMTTSEPVPEGSALPAWPPVNSTDRSPHMSLDATLQLRSALLPERARFWDEIYERHYRNPAPPPPPPPKQT